MTQLTTLLDRQKFAARQMAKACGVKYDIALNIIIRKGYHKQSKDASPADIFWTIQQPLPQPGARL
jgi:hypothetical protein|tara:strand:- start:493 stop:690 length:198 start_codon:yes stop_codon:yes gene_type:complete